jgi:predicted PurR-regulated permease PerM
MTPEPGAHRDAGLRFLVAAACIVVVIAGLRAAAALILPFLIAVFLAVVNVPLMNWLVRMRVPKPLAVLLTVLAVASVIGVLVALLAQSVNQLTEVIPRYRARVGELATSVTALGATLGLPVEQLREEWQSVSLAAFGTADTIGAIIGNTGAIVGNAVRTIGAFLSNAFLVFLTVVFILFEAAGFTAKIKLAFGAGRDPFGHLGRISAQIQTYLVTKATVSAATGVIVGIWVAIMGLDFPLLWGVVAFMFNFIPTLGSIFAAIPAVLLALLQLGPGPAVIIAAGYLLVNVAFGNLIEPTLLGRRLGLSTLVVFVSLVFWGWVWGPVGMLFSVPLTMVVKIALENTADLRWLAVMLDANPAVSARKRGASAA